MAVKKGKKLKETQNVAIGKKTYTLISAYCNKKGYKIGAFFELAAFIKMEMEKVS